MSSLTIMPGDIVFVRQLVGGGIVGHGILEFVYGGNIPDGEYCYPPPRSPDQLVPKVTTFEHGYSVYGQGWPLER